MKRMIALSAGLISLSIILIGSVMIILFNNQSHFSDFFETFGGILLFVSLPSLLYIGYRLYVHSRKE